jgi:hypothetical protein
MEPSNPHVGTLPVELPDPEPIDLLGDPGAPVLRRVLPIVAAAVLATLVLVVLRRRRGR